MVPLLLAEFQHFSKYLEYINTLETISHHSVFHLISKTSIVWN